MTGEIILSSVFMNLFNKILVLMSAASEPSCWNFFRIVNWNVTDIECASTNVHRTDCLVVL